MQVQQLMRKTYWPLAICMVIFFLGYTYLTVWTATDYRGVDGRVWYIAAATWQEGASAYDREAYAERFYRWQEEQGQDDKLDNINRSVFVSPPTVAPLMYGMTLLKWPDAMIILDSFQLLSFLAIAFFCIKLTATNTDIRKEIDPYTVFVIALAGCLGAINNTMNYGQMGVFALAGGIGAIYAWRDKNFWLCVAMVLLSSFKPHVAAFCIMFLMGAGAWRALFTAGFIALGFFVFLEAPHGMLEFFERFEESMVAYGAHPLNVDPIKRVGFGGFFSAENNLSKYIFLATTGIGAIISFILGHFARQDKFDKTYLIMVVLALAPICIPLFGCDAIAASALLIMSRYWKSIWARLLIVIAFVGASEAGGIDNKIIHANTPLLGAFDGYMLQILVIGSFLSVIAVSTWAYRISGKPQESLGYGQKISC